MVTKSETTKTNKKTSTSKLDSKLTLINVQLQSINGQLLSSDISEDFVKFNRQNNVTLLEIKDKEIRIKLSERLFFSPEGPFRLDLEILGAYKYKGKLIESDILKEIDEIAHPLYSYASLVIAFITERFVTLPMIMAPYKAEEDYPEAP
ncbi:hypothetical protein JT05_05510 [Desulfosporosinus sp. Tol-M]|jgi:hypothetical protein|nr:hypothetical protein JT05_05510 [Desulfosporosinus sp. Tol-M]